VYIYEPDSQQVWSQRAIVTAPDQSSYDYFGFSVRIGTAALAVGAYRDRVGYNNAGSAYIFRHIDASIWTLEAKLVSGDGGEDEYFGAVVDVDKSDSLVAVAAFGDDYRRGVSFSFSSEPLALTITATALCCLTRGCLPLRQRSDVSKVDSALQINRL
jgi:hypothetical protein